MNCYNQTVIYLITKDRRTKKCIVTIVEKKLMTMQFNAHIVEEIQRTRIIMIMAHHMYLIMEE